MTSTLKEKRISPKHLCFTDEATELSIAKGSSSSYLSIPFFLFYPKGKHTRCPLVIKRRRINVEESTHKGWVLCLTRVGYPGEYITANQNSELVWNVCTSINFITKNPSTLSGSGLQKNYCRVSLCCWHDTSWLGNWMEWWSLKIHCFTSSVCSGNR